MSGPERVYISVAEALSLVEANLPAPRIERVHLDHAAGRVLAEEIIARENLPAFASSAMDGYCIRVGDVSGASRNNPVDLPLAGEIAAGVTPPEDWPPGSCLRILTGAPVPEEAAGVVPVEETEEIEGGVRFHADIDSPGAHIRPAGEDLAPGDRVLAPGQRIGSAEIALLAAIGVEEIAATRRQRVAFLATGDELLAPGEAPRPGAIRNSNTPMTMAMLAEVSAHAVDLGVAPDREEALAAMLAPALESCDMLVSSGGVSAGRYDLVGKALEDLGAEWIFHKVRQQPGKPLAFMLWKGKPVFGLPGNPVSSFFTFWYYVAPALRKMTGLTDAHPRHVRALLSSGLAGRRRQFFARANTRWVGDHYETEARPPHGSHILSSLARANSFIILPEGTERLEAGAEVTVAFFEGR